MESYFRTICTIFLAIVVQCCSTLNIYEHFQLRAPEGATSEEVEASAKALILRLTHVGIMVRQHTINNNLITLEVNQEHQKRASLSIGMLCQYPAKSMYFRICARRADGPGYIESAMGDLHTIAEINRMEPPNDIPGSMWIPRILSEEARHQANNLSGSWKALLIWSKGEIPLKVPAQFIWGENEYRFPRAYYLIPDDVINNVGQMIPFKRIGDYVVALCVDGHALTRGIILSGPINCRDSNGKAIKVKGPVICLRTCEGYDMEIESIIRYSMPFPLERIR